MGFLNKIFGENKYTKNPKPDIDALLKSGDTDRLILDLDMYVCKLCAYGDVLKNLTDQQKVFYFNQSLETEINNGGFNQYFYNSSGDFANETIMSLQIIGADKTAEILRLAIQEFPNAEAPSNRSDRQNMLEYIDERSEAVWEELTERFLKYEDNLYELNIEYIKNNKNNF